MKCVTGSSQYEVLYTAAALEDMLALDHSTRQRVADGIKRASFKPLPKSEGGYGKPLGHKRGLNLTSLLEIKFRGMGIRAVYELIRVKQQMQIIVVSVREDELVFREALKRRQRLK
jgi:mRNA interferase RelE/StbE